MQELVQLEERGWRALATEGDLGRAFYGSILREDTVMLLPGGLRIDTRDRILESLGSQPWESFRMEGTSVIRLTDSAATVVYKVTAHRKDSLPYVALISSSYARDPDWKLVAHQQTPA